MSFGHTISGVLVDSSEESASAASRFSPLAPADALSCFLDITLDEIHFSRNGACFDIWFAVEQMKRMKILPSDTDSSALIHETARKIQQGERDFSVSEHLVGLVNTVWKSPNPLAHFLWENHADAEAFQIMGIYYNAKNRTLYINELSDFDLYAELGFPIRICQKNAKSKRNPTQISIHACDFEEMAQVRYAPNMHIFRSLFGIRGYEMGEYQQRLDMLAERCPQLLAPNP